MKNDDYIEFLRYGVFWSIFGTFRHSTLKKVSKCILLFFILTEQTNIDTGYSKKASRVHKSRIDFSILDVLTDSAT
jgi:hypothetical protein